MKLVSYLREETDQLAILVDGLLYHTQELHPDLPNNMGMFLMMWEDVIDIAKQADALLKTGKNPGSAIGIPVGNVQLLSPVPFPTSCRVLLTSVAFTSPFLSSIRTSLREVYPRIFRFRNAL